MMEMDTYQVVCTGCDDDDDDDNDDDDEDDDSNDDDGGEGDDDDNDSRSIRCTVDPDFVLIEPR